MESFHLTYPLEFDFDNIECASSPLTTVFEEGLGQNVLYSSQDHLSRDESDHQSIECRFSKRQKTAFVCEACCMRFTEKRALARHKKTDRHRKRLGLPPDRRYECFGCGKLFTRGHDLKRHQDEQHENLPIRNAEDFSSSNSECGSEQRPSEDGHMSPQSVPQASDRTSITSFSSNVDAFGTSPQLLHLCGPSADADAYSHFITDSPKTTVNGSLVDHRFPRGNQNTVPYAQSLADNDAGSICPELSESPVSTNRSSSVSDEGESYAATDYAHPVPGNVYQAARLCESVFNQDTRTCFKCGDIFQSNSNALVTHLQKHLDDFTGQHRCGQCQIDFSIKADLDKHLQSAAQGHCGFTFDHNCTGHHPPLPDNITCISDHDRVALRVRLHRWEEAQLHAYIGESNELTAVRPAHRPSRWSDVFVGGTRRDSFASFTLSVDTHATAPCDSSDGKLDIGGLQKRLQYMSLGDAGARVRRLMHPNSSPEPRAMPSSLRDAAQRIHTSSSSDLRSRTIDRSLKKAVRRSDVHKVAHLLGSGADPSIIHENSGPFIAMALWGPGQVSDVMTNHRIDEEIMGNCSACNMATHTFENGYNKVSALLRHRVDPSAQNGLFGTPLATAAWMGKDDIVKLLFQYGADVRQKGGKFGTALCAAASEAGYPGHCEVVQVLLRSGATAKEQGPEGSAVELAKQRKKYWEDQSGADPENEVLHARIKHCDEVVRLLEQSETVVWSHGPKKRRNQSSCRDKPLSSTSSTANHKSLGTKFIQYWVGTA